MPQEKLKGDVTVQKKDGTQTKKKPQREQHPSISNMASPKRTRPSPPPTVTGQTKAHTETVPHEVDE